MDRNAKYVQDLSQSLGGKLVQRVDLKKLKCVKLAQSSRMCAKLVFSICSMDFQWK